MSATLRSRRRRNGILATILLSALLLRIGIMVRSRSYDIGADADHFSFGYESGRIARSLALGQGFASPFPYPTGPTAHLAPLYPVLLSGIFRVFGIYTPASAVVAFLLNTIAVMFTCVVLYRIGTRIFGAETGLVAATLLAVSPASIWFSSNVIWDTSLLAFCVAALALWFYLLPLNPSIREMLLTGLWIGLASLLNPMVWLAVLVGIIWMWIRWRGPGTERILKPLLAASVGFAILLPWMIRNALVIGEFTPRGSFGMNLSSANNEEVWEARTGGPRTSTSPQVSQLTDVTAASLSPTAQRMRELGEGGYDRACIREALAFIRAHPDRFLYLTGDRIRGWWLGDASALHNSAHLSFDLTLWKRLAFCMSLPLFVAGSLQGLRRGRAILPLLAMILVFPLPYYVSGVISRYRFPIEPLMLIPTAFCLTSIFEALQGRFAGTRAEAPANTAISGGSV